MNTNTPLENLASEKLRAVEPMLLKMLEIYNIVNNFTAYYNSSYSNSPTKHANSLKYVLCSALSAETKILKLRYFWDFVGSQSVNKFGQDETGSFKLCLTHGTSSDTYIESFFAALNFSLASMKISLDAVYLMNFHVVKVINSMDSSQRAGTHYQAVPADIHTEIILSRSARYNCAIRIEFPPIPTKGLSLSSQMLELLSPAFNSNHYLYCMCPLEMIASFLNDKSKVDKFCSQITKNGWLNVSSDDELGKFLLAKL